jgi:hypothetical protein
MGTKEEAGRHFVIVRPKAGGREQKTTISFSSSQNCCRTEGTVGEIQGAAKSGCLVLARTTSDGLKSLELLRRP